MQQIIAECKTQWKEDRPKASQSISKDSQSAQPDKELTLAESITTGLSTVEDVIYAKKHLDEIIKENEGALNQRDVRNLKKKLKKKAKKLKKQNPNQFDQLDEERGSSEGEGEINKKVTMQKTEQKSVLNGQTFRTLNSKLSPVVYDDPFEYILPNI
jgi:hypothetical protein